MYKIAVIGNRDSVLGFRVLGLDVFPTEDTDAGRRTLHRLAQEDYAVIYITEQLAQQLTAEIARYKDAPLPAVILIPGKTGSLGIAGAETGRLLVYLNGGPVAGHIQDLSDQMLGAYAHHIRHAGVRHAVGHHQRAGDFDDLTHSLAPFRKYPRPRRVPPPRAAPGPPDPVRRPCRG